MIGRKLDPIGNAGNGGDGKAQRVQLVSFQVGSHMQPRSARQRLALDQLDPQPFDPAILPIDQIAHQHSTRRHDVRDAREQRLPGSRSHRQEEHGVDMHEIEVTDRLAEFPAQRR